MSRLFVPRGNPPLPVFQLADASPLWEWLTHEEQDIARRTVEERPVMFLGIALQVLAECLCDFRRARDPAELELLDQRFNCVLARAIDGAMEGALRARYSVPAKVRLMLLGAGRADAVRLSEAAVQAILDLYRTGAQPSPRLCRYDVARFLDQDATPQRWDENARWLATTDSLRCSLGEYLHHELRAFAQDPPPDPLLAARGPRYEHAVTKAPASPDPPEPCTVAAVERATRHARALLGYAQLVVDKATRQPTDSAGNTANDIGGYAAEQWEWLGRELGESGCLSSLRDHLHRFRQENYVVGGVVQPSVHEAIRELARRVWMAFRSGVCVTNDRLEAKRWIDGPWQGHEVVASFAWFREHAGELVTALDSLSFQTLEADLKRESAQLKSSLHPPPPTETRSAQQDKGASDNKNGRGRKPKKEVPPEVKERIISCFDKGTKNAENLFGLVGAEDHGLTVEDVERTISSYSRQERRKKNPSARTKRR